MTAVRMGLSGFRLSLMLKTPCKFRMFDHLGLWHRLHFPDGRPDAASAFKVGANSVSVSGHTAGRLNPRGPTQRTSVEASSRHLGRAADSTRISAIIRFRIRCQCIFSKTPLHCPAPQAHSPRAPQGASSCCARCTLAAWRARLTEAGVGGTSDYTRESRAGPASQLIREE